ncbi:MAG: hypothetical protein AAF704_15805, partial [Cyanobacteria bacterium P01_D01_bin.123]
MAKPTKLAKRSALKDARALAPRIKELVRARQAELRECASIAESRQDDAGRRAVGLLRDLEVHLRREWNYVPNESLWTSNIEAILRKNMKKAMVFKRELDAIKGATADETRFKRNQRLIEIERDSLLTKTERKIYYHATKIRGTLSDDEERVDPPGLLAYLAAWFTVIALVGCTFVYLVQITSSDYGVGRSDLWLVSVIVMTTLFYAIILPIEILFFQLFLPSLLAKRMERMANPVRVKRFPYKTALPFRSPIAYLCAIDSKVRKSRIGNHVMGLQTGDNQVDVWDQLDVIYYDTTWVPHAGTRFYLGLVAFLLVMPDFAQSVVFEEFLLLIPLFATVSTDFFELPKALDTT